MHAIDPVSGRIADKLQELLFVEEGKLATADKTRIALASRFPRLRTFSSVDSSRNSDMEVMESI